jgi:hypothetical protein
MSTIIPKSQTLKQAIKWISDARQERPDAKLFDLVGEASRRYNLSPMEEEALFSTIKAEVDALEKQKD